MNVLSDLKQNIEISFSQFSKYKHCPWKYFIEKIVNIGILEKSIYLYFGKAFHQIVQKKLENPDRSISDLKNDFKIAFFYLMHKDEFKCEPTEFAEFVKQANDIFDNIPFEKILEEYEVISVEHDFYEEIISKISFHGIIDFVLKNKKTGKYLIGDWKTSTKPWTNWKINDANFTAQLQFYKFFWAKKEDISLDDVETEYWVVCREGKEKFVRVPMNFDKKTIKFGIGELKHILKSIYVDKKFNKIKFTNSNKCKFCVYNNKLEFCNEEPNQKLPTQS